MPFIPPTFVTLGDGFVIDKAETTHAQYPFLVWCTDAKAEDAPSQFMQILASLRLKPGLMVLVGADAKVLPVDLPRGMHGQQVLGYTRMHAEFQAIRLSRELRARARP